MHHLFCRFIYTLIYVQWHTYCIVSLSVCPALFIYSTWKYIYSIKISYALLKYSLAFLAFLWIVSRASDMLDKRSNIELYTLPYKVTLKTKIFPRFHWGAWKPQKLCQRKQKKVNIKCIRPVFLYWLVHPCHVLILVLS